MLSWKASLSSSGLTLTESAKVMLKSPTKEPTLVKMAVFIEPSVIAVATFVAVASARADSL